MTIKAIPTKYNGITFRSRTEARWAAFFDQLEIKYVYEPEGIEFFDGTKYLPDFYLEDMDAYFECKSAPGKLTEEELHKIDLMKRWNRLIIGYADFTFESNIISTELNYPKFMTEFDDSIFCYCLHCGCYSIMSGWFKTKCLNCGYGNEYERTVVPNAIDGDMKCIITKNDAVKNAYEYAMALKFGERGMKQKGTQNDQI